MNQLIISHRGNLDGPDPSMENMPEAIIYALSKKFQVEVDVWFIGKQLWLGHDEPQYKVDPEFLLFTPYLWLHCKNIEALWYMAGYKITRTVAPIHFFHNTYDCTLTSNGLLWTYPGKTLTDISIAVLPEKAKYTRKELKKCLGFCTDYPIKYQKKFQ